MLVARAGFRVFEIGRVVEREVRKSGFSVIRELGGHGIGRTIHEAPHVPNYADPRQPGHEGGLVITVEPIISSGSDASLRTMTVGRTYRRSLPIGPFRANARDYFGIPFYSRLARLRR